MTDEEERAQLYREDCAARARFRAGLCAQLAGDTAAASAVRESWAPLLPPFGWDCPGPSKPARPAWADRVPGDFELPNYLTR